MNSRIFITAISFFALILAGGMISCEGPEGPAGPIGPTGPAGPAGPNGQNGADGVAGTTSCMDCHESSQLIAAKVFQYKMSGHYTGGHYYENATSCAVCHTSQGFLERLELGGMTTSATIEDPLPPNCYTCHQIHQSYTTEDWNFTKSEAEAFWVTDEIIDIGKGNQCVGCHQSRIRELGIPSDPLPPALDSDSMIYLNTTRYGPHHGSQGLMFVGTGGAERSDVTFESSPHTTLITDACITCHMATFDPELGLGGHQFGVVNEEGEMNTAGCIQCHSADEAESLREETQAEIRTMLYALGGRLMELGLLRDTTGANAWRTVQDTFPSAHVGALYNAIFIYEDQTLGVHNAKYARALLEESMKVLDN
jgi:hypothetical protein